MAKKNILEDRNSLVIQSISALPAQLKQTWINSSKIKISPQYAKVKNIIFCGMGGSNLASEMIRAVFSAEIKLPFILVRNYDLPAFANKDTLVIISSYSGNTEEPINCFKQALKIKAKIICIATGGKIAEIAKENKIPVLKMDEKLNPAQQPRYGIGSQLGASLNALNKCRIIKFSSSQINSICNQLEELNVKWSDKSANNNETKISAQKLKGFMPLIISADFLLPNAHILTNQINESAKTLCLFNAIPELNHHLMEGLELPKEIIKKIKVIFLESDLYSKEIKKRFSVTEKVLEKKGIKFLKQKFSGKDKISSGVEALCFGSWLSYYLSQINHKDPTLIPWVNFFKEKLRQAK